MQIDDPLQMNDWGIKKFLVVTLSLQLVMWGMLGLDTLGVTVPLLRQLIAFIYLTFVPGMIILRILRLHKLGNIETLLYAVGLSVATLMFTGALINTVLPLVGIARPIAKIPLLASLSAVTLILCVISYIRDKSFAASPLVNIKDFLSPSLLLLCLLPFLSIFGTYLVNARHDNTLLILLIAVIALLVLLIGFDKLVPRNLYPLAVLVIAISLLFYRSLISPYISGFDIHSEYYYANLTITNALWNPVQYGVMNAMLSITMLAPIYSLVGNMELGWVFKIIYPLLFSFTLLGLYRVFQRQTNDRIAFLACFFFMLLTRFYHDLAVMPRQLTGTLFLVLLILPMIDKGMDKTKRMLLFIIFGASLVVSHYALSYIYMFCLIFAWVILFFWERPVFQTWRRRIISHVSKHNSTSEDYSFSDTPDNRTINVNFVLLFVVGALTWYIYVSSSTVFNVYVNLANHIINNMSAELLSPWISLRAQWFTTQTHHVQLLQMLNSMIKVYSGYLINIFVIVGFLVAIFKRKISKICDEYIAFTTGNLVIFLICIIATSFYSFFSVGSIDVERIINITLIFLTPFCIIGVIAALRAIGHVIKLSWVNRITQEWFKLISVFFGILFLVNTGVVMEIAHTYSGSVSIGQEWDRKYGDVEMKTALYSAVTPEQDIYSARWLSVNRDPGEKIFATYSDIQVHPLTSYGMILHTEVPELTESTRAVPSGCYVYLQYLNVKEKIGTEFDPNRYFDMDELASLYNIKNKIYSNGGSEIYR